jgi:hypothetical protein
MTDTNKMAQYMANWQDERNGAALNGLRVSPYANLPASNVDLR